MLLFFLWETTDPHHVPPISMNCERDETHLPCLYFPKVWVSAWGYLMSNNCLNETAFLTHTLAVSDCRFCVCSAATLKHNSNIFLHS